MESWLSEVDGEVVGSSLLISLKFLMSIEVRLIRFMPGNESIESGKMKR